MTEPTDRDEALRAQHQAELRLATVRDRRGRVERVRDALSEILEENHFSVRLSRALDIKDDRK